MFQIIRDVVSNEQCNISCSTFQCYILLSYETIAASVHASFMIIVSKSNIVPNHIHLNGLSTYLLQSYNNANTTKQSVYKFVSNPHIFISVGIYNIDQMLYDAVRCIYGDAKILELINDTIYTRFDACDKQNYPKTRDFQVISSGNSIFVVIYSYEYFTVNVDMKVKITKSMGIFLNPYSYQYLEVYKPIYIILPKEYSNMGMPFQSVHLYHPPYLTVSL